jgi:hypothetical protein
MSQAVSTCPAFRQRIAREKTSAQLYKAAAPPPPVAVLARVRSCGYEVMGSWGPIAARLRQRRTGEGEILRLRRRSDGEENILRHVSWTPADGWCMRELTPQEARAFRMGSLRYRARVLSGEIAARPRAAASRA